MSGNSEMENVIESLEEPEEAVDTLEDENLVTQEVVKDLEDLRMSDNGEGSEVAEEDVSLSVILQKKALQVAESNDVEALRQLLEEMPSLVDARDQDLYTPLHRACYSNNVEAVKVLLSFGADIAAKTEDGWEPLHCACNWDNVEVASFLLQNGANVNATTKGGVTPLHLAAANPAGRRTLELLLWHPYIDASIKNDSGDAAYDIAVRSSHLSRLFEILDDPINIY